MRKSFQLLKTSSHQVGFCCIGVAALMVSSSASAVHYYGVIQANVYGGHADEGASVLINTDFLFDTSPGSQIVSHELWYGVVTTMQFWVEVGFMCGEHYDGFVGCWDVVWADGRNGGGYHEHYPGNSWNYDTWYAASVQRTSSTSCSWDVYLGAVKLGTSTANCLGANRALAAGIETSDRGSGYAKGWLFGWQELDSSWTWRNDWDGRWLRPDAPPYIQFTDSTTQAMTVEEINDP